MRQKTIGFLIILFAALKLGAQHQAFAMLDSLPGVKICHAYYGSDNFLGQAVDGYESKKLLATLATYRALYEVQKDLKQDGLGLKIFDAYRPQQAVDHFVRWARKLNDTAMKHKHYPNVPKDSLFAQGYIAAKSGHSRGSTVDVTLYNLSSGKELDMGTPFDYFGPESWPFSHTTTVKQHQNRMKLREAMMAHGFMPLNTEWWHFTLKPEPFPNTFFDFPID